MQQQITIKLLPSEAASGILVTQYIARTAGVPVSAVTGYLILKQSVDARGKQPWIHLTVQAFIYEPLQERKQRAFIYKDVHTAPVSVLIAGAGPAGLFAALRLLEAGIKPIIVERGKDVRARRRDLAQLNRAGEVNPESNYCFGEGGAGTYSDGKLYTRSSKRGDITRILEIFTRFGADERILYEAHPHIGTNKLPHIISAMREQVIACGGEVRFNTKLTGLELHNGELTGIRTANGEIISGTALILATGHSARDIFTLLHNRKLTIEAKPFALGVRVEHPQSIIDTVQYHCKVRDQYLPPAAYSWVQQVDGKGVFSFCMCPGGIIAPAATAPGELVVNGWSPSKRNNPYANSGIVVSVETEDLKKFAKYGPLAAMYFQQEVEQKAFTAGGGKLVAPAQRLADFTRKKNSGSLPRCSYQPGVIPVQMEEVLPAFIADRLRQGFIETGKKMNQYITNEALVVATESRTSSPVRIPRDPVLLSHPQVHNLFPCGEGAGYAGGIVSAAMDGERIAERIAAQYGG